MELTQTIQVLDEVLECFETRNVKGASVGVAGAQAFNIKSQGYTLSVKKKKSAQIYECLQRVAERHNLSILDKEGYWVLYKPLSP